MLVYIGSAHGPGGLRARVLRHFRADKPLRWHIDYLTVLLAPEMVVWEAGDRYRECAWVHRLMAWPGVRGPVPGFGSSDCLAGCPAHLLSLPEAISDQELRVLLWDPPPPSCRPACGNTATR